MSASRLQHLASLLRQAAELCEQMASESMPKKKRHRSIPRTARDEENVRELQRNLRRNGVVVNE